MIDWFSSLSTELQFFYGLGIISAAVLIIQLLMLLIGLGDDMDVGDIDADHDMGDASGGLHVLSVRTVVAFFTGFSWTGAFCTEKGLAFPLTLLVSFSVGAIFMASVFYLMRFLYTMRQSGSLDYQNAIGLVGSVYLPIPPNQTGPGQIEVMVQGRLKVVQAFTKHQEKIMSRSKVRVVALLDQNTLLVEPLS